ncbi:succinylglutamate desuccinylase/aspartoacylase family protein [Acidithiobacillus thiooxidans]|uniref:N-alpha-acetyl-L-2,4-diaminobutyric acid deacetylase n=1 Tax=Acidithiobacillus thiooxidans ATCC 19377 TaxID=637390 RepID=A0A543Q000_ACITH|nr:succinylglutamate desuccinylase/aspartoacylase family protein [Acidithiobacillus thiooxidans]MDX5936346.1 succinylglutamate desuccinylase/aspartoacylase family protein [Acidithiobacillus thiooxidans]TQN49653.1 N-alpha-acetyl-L-2,4-diaminobutyric acid deacetylase [Acidithiobacillus thiooxidans ATCC 19377]
MSIKVITYEGLKDGPSLVLLGNIHGNEYCGYRGLSTLIRDIDEEKYIVNAGRLIIIPMCNPKANKISKRYVDRDLNRNLFPPKINSKYEDYLANIICPILDSADFLVDLHSFGAKGEAMVMFGGENETETKFARALGFKNYLYGWREFHGISEEDTVYQGTTEYARKSGCRAVTVECGSNSDANSERVAYIAALRAAIHLSILVPPEDPDIETIVYNKNEQQCARITKEVIMRHGMVPVESFTNFQFIKRKQMLCTISDTESIMSECDGYVIMPSEKAIIGDIFFTIAKSCTFPEGKYNN